MESGTPPAEAWMISTHMLAIRDAVKSTARALPCSTIARRNEGSALSILHAGDRSGHSFASRKIAKRDYLILAFTPRE